MFPLNFGSVSRPRFLGVPGPSSRQKGCAGSRIKHSCHDGIFFLFLVSSKFQYSFHRALSFESKNNNRTIHRENNNKPVKRLHSIRLICKRRKKGDGRRKEGAIFRRLSCITACWPNRWLGKRCQRARSRSAPMPDWLAISSLLAQDPFSSACCRINCLARCLHFGGDRERFIMSCSLFFMAEVYHKKDVCNRC